MIHTPGPWVYVFEPDGYRHQILSDNSQVAQVMPSDSSAADGLLIAAAPALLAALQCLLTLQPDYPPHGRVSSQEQSTPLYKAVFAACAAIAKATGSGS